MDSSDRQATMGKKSIQNLQVPKDDRD